MRLHSFHKFASIRVIGGFQLSFLTANYANKRKLIHYDFCRLTAAATWIEEQLQRRPVNGRGGTRHAIMSGPGISGLEAARCAKLQRFGNARKIGSNMKNEKSRADHELTHELHDPKLLDYEGLEPSCGLITVTAEIRGRRRIAHSCVRWCRQGESFRNRTSTAPGRIRA